MTELSNDYVYDIETYPNFFSAAFEHCHSDSTWYFELSEERNDITAFIEFIHQLRTLNARMVGYNNLGFDYPIIHMICTAAYVTNDLIFQKCDAIIHGGNGFDHMVWESDWIVEQMDLYKIHHFDNAAKRTSLKVLEFNMRSHNIEDLPFEPGVPLPRHALPMMRQYNKHDVSETKKFYHHSLPAIRMREELTTKYSRNFLNHNDTKIGKDYFIMKLEEQMPGSCYYKDPTTGRKTPRQTIRASIPLADVIFPYISFEQNGFANVMNYLKSQIITETKGVFIGVDCDYNTAITADPSTIKVFGISSFEVKRILDDKIRKKFYASVSRGSFIMLDELYEHLPDLYLASYRFVMVNLNCQINGFTYTFGVGGIHGSVDSQIVESDNDYAIIDVDVASYYPNISIANRLYPEHLSDTFCDIYKDVYEQRKATDKKSPENAMLKLALNGVYGDSNNVYSPFYDPAYTMSITINGQLLLCMLAEQLLKITGLTVIQINTDGVTVKIPRPFMDQLDNVCKWWEQFTLLTLESVEYNRMFIRDVNSYIGEYTNTDGKECPCGCGSLSGKVKRIGAYCYETAAQNPATRELPWHKNHSALVVAKAAEAVLVHGQDVGQFIRNHNDYMDFMLRAKVPRSSKLVGVDSAGIDQPLQNITRYYVTHDGVALIKIMPPLARNPGVYRRIGIDVGWKVSPCNNLDHVRSPINYDYYIEQANKLIKRLE